MVKGGGEGGGREGWLVVAGVLLMIDLQLHVLCNVQMADGVAFILAAISNFLNIKGCVWGGGQKPWVVV